MISNETIAAWRCARRALLPLCVMTFAGVTNPARAADCMFEPQGEGRVVAVIDGRTVQETDAGGKSAAEMAELWKFVQGRMTKSTNPRRRASHTRVVGFLQEVFEEQYSFDLSDVAKKGLKQCHVAETEKYAHVTFFFNGGVEKKFEGEDRELIPSPKVATYDLDPKMSAAGVALNDRQAPVFSPETFETNVPGLFVAGGAVAGIDTGTIFIENGRFHGEKLVEVIAGRLTRG